MKQPTIALKGLLVGLCVAFGAPAAAQYGSAPPPPPPDIPRPSQNERGGAPAAPAAPAAPTELLRAAACAIGQNAGVGTAIMGAVPRSPDEREKATALLRAGQRCLHLSSAISTPVLMARGAAAEALYEIQFATPAAARAPALGAAPLPRPAGGDDPVAAQLAPMYGLVDCATPRQPDLVRALLATEPRSPEETTALTALNPTLVACVPRGTPISIDPRIMRGMYAEALYRWSVVQRDGPASPWAAAAAPAAAATPAG